MPLTKEKQFYAILNTFEKLHREVPTVQLIGRVFDIPEKDYGYLVKDNIVVTDTVDGVPFFTFTKYNYISIQGFKEVTT